MAKTDITGPKLMTQAEYARHREARGLPGGTRQSVKQAVDGGRITTIGPDKLIDAAVADIQWERNSRARAVSRPAVAQTAAGMGAGTAAANDAPQGPISAPGAPTADPSRAQYQDHRTRREAAEAEKAELELARMSGRVIDKARSVQAVYDAFHALRDALLATSRRVAPQVVGLADVREIEHLMDAELRKSFAAFEAKMLATLDQREAA